MRATRSADAGRACGGRARRWPASTWRRPQATRRRGSGGCCERGPRARPAAARPRPPPRAAAKRRWTRAGGRREAAALEGVEARRFPVITNRAVQRFCGIAVEQRRLARARGDGAEADDAEPGAELGDAQAAHRGAGLGSATCRASRRQAVGQHARPARVRVEAAALSCAPRPEVVDRRRRDERAQRQSAPSAAGSVVTSGTPHARVAGVG